jgi:pilus assembly protein Flp/PilA
MKTLVRFAKCESGATAIEYGLIAALISVAIISVVTSVGNSLSQTFQKVNTGLSGAGAAPAD